MLHRLGDQAAAIDAFRASLEVFPTSGWALKGLEAALEAHSDHAAAHATRTQYRAAWVDADVRLTSACPQFDEPRAAPTTREAEGAQGAEGAQASGGLAPLGYTCLGVLLGIGVAIGGVHYCMKGGRARGGRRRMNGPWMTEVTPSGM